MKTLLIAAALAAAVPAAASHHEKGHDAKGHAGHAAPKAETKTLEGEVVDMACYMAHEGKGAKHAKCADMCVKGGAPAGLLSGDQLYVLVNDHGNEKPFAEAKALAGGNAKITGKVVTRGGVQSLIVSKAEKK